MNLNAVGPVQSPSLTIKLVSQKKMDRLQKAAKAKESISPYTMLQRVLGNKAYTETVVNCNTVTLQNADQVMLAHLSPYQLGGPKLNPDGTLDPNGLWSDIKPGLEADVVELRKKGEPLQALIAGGQDYDFIPHQNFSTVNGQKVFTGPKIFRKNVLAPGSRRLFNELNKNCKDLQIKDVSTIWGSLSDEQCNNVSILANPKKKRIYLNISNDTGEILSFEKLLENIRILRIAAGHTLETATKTIQGPWEKCLHLVQLNAKKLPGLIK